MNKVIDNYVLKQVIGQGQYGKVYKAFNTHTYGLYAVKVIKVDKLKELPKLQEFTLNQIKILSKIEHPNIVKFIQMLKTANNMYLVYEFCEHGTLEELISKKKYLSEEETIAIMKQLLAGFKALVENNILHRDVKPSNILISNGIVKIADFGFCKTLEPTDMAHTMVGSPIYMAPQILKGASYTTKADIWSLGVVAYECLYGFCPYEDKSIAKLIKLIDNKDLYFPPAPKISKALQEIIRRMLTISPSKRIEWQNLFDSPLFNQTKEKFTLNKLQDLEYFKAVESPKATSRSEQEQNSVTNNFLSFLAKQRRKALYLVKVVDSVNASSPESEGRIRICRLILSKTSDIYSRMFHAIRKIDTNHQYTQSQKEELRNSKQLAGVIEILSGEKQAVADCHKLYRGQSTSEQQSTLKLYTQQMLEYARQLQKHPEREALVLCNQIIDCVLLGELFENFIDHEIGVQDQQYFRTISKADSETLRKMTEHKLRYAEHKYHKLQ